MGSTKMTNVPCVLHTTLPSTFSVSLVVASIDLLFVVVLNVSLPHGICIYAFKLRLFSGLHAMC